ncbi:hypothetical protein BY458DRAFT_558056 [Sporodiniella umbellata]|nr:hypothetical protein BY458DRAFT_558056 [Sporodiniella umbellata]
MNSSSKFDLFYQDPFFQNYVPEDFEDKSDEAETSEAVDSQKKEKGKEVEKIDSRERLPTKKRNELAKWAKEIDAKKTKRGIKVYEKYFYEKSEHDLSVQAAAEKRMDYKGLMKTLKSHDWKTTIPPVVKALLKEMDTLNTAIEAINKQEFDLSEDGCLDSLAIDDSDQEPEPSASLNPHSNTDSSNSSDIESSESDSTSCHYSTDDNFENTDEDDSTDTYIYEDSS